MSTKKILRWALDAETGSGPEKTLLLALAIHADNEGLVSPGPSWSTLQRQARLSRSATHKAIRGLEGAGLIICAGRQRANGSHSSCEYLLGIEANLTPDPSTTRTGTRPPHGRVPVQEMDPSTTRTGRPVHHTDGSLPAETVGPVHHTDPTRPPHGPLEVRDKELKELAAARYARDAHAHAREAAPNGDRNGSGVHEKLQRLAETATSKDAYVLVAQWRVNHATQLPQKFYDQVTKAVQQLLDDKDLNAEPALIRQALEKLDRRPDAGPALLPDFYTDMLRDRNDRMSKPAFDEYGYPQRPLEEITDEDLTRPVLERIIGEDTKLKYEYPPDEIENDPTLRTEWYAKQRDRRLAHWRAAAREKLAMRQQRAT